MCGSFVYMCELYHPQQGPSGSGGDEANTVTKHYQAEQSQVRAGVEDIWRCTHPEEGQRKSIHRCLLAYPTNPVFMCIRESI